jgi:hypothetical protein
MNFSDVLKAMNQASTLSFILRHNGVDIGEKDFLGACWRLADWQKVLRRAIETQLAGLLHRIDIERPPAFKPHAFKRFDIAFVDSGRIGTGRYGTIETRLTDQVKRGVGRTIGVIAEVTGFGIGKAVVRVKMGYLQGANQSLRAKHHLRQIDKIGEVIKMLKDIRG